MAKSIQFKNSNNENIYPYALLKEFVLYNDNAGSNGTITLSDNVSNYKYVEIFYYKYYTSNDKGYNHSVKVYNPNEKTVSLVFAYKSSDTSMQIGGASIEIKGKSITWKSNGGINFGENHFNLFSNAETKITRVVGYK